MMKNYTLHCSALKTIAAEEVASPVVATEYYSINGVPISAPQKGLNIIKTRHANGKTNVKKIVKH
jgi:hypothetical protein